MNALIQSWQLLLWGAAVAVVIANYVYEGRKR